MRTLADNLRLCGRYIVAYVNFSHIHQFFNRICNCFRICECFSRICGSSRRYDHFWSHMWTFSVVYADVLHMHMRLVFAFAFYICISVFLMNAAVFFNTHLCGNMRIWSAIATVENFQMFGNTVITSSCSSEKSS